MRSGEAVLSSVADSFSGIAFVASPRGALEHLSPSFYEITGANPTAPPLQAMRAVVHPNDWSRVLARWTGSVASRTPFQSFLRLRRKDGQIRWLMARARHLGAPQEEAAPWFGVLLFMDDLPVLQLAGGLEPVASGGPGASFDLGPWLMQLPQRAPPGLYLTSAVHEKLTVATSYAAAAAHSVETATPQSLLQARDILHQVTDELVTLGRLIRAGGPTPALMGLEPAHGEGER